MKKVNLGFISLTPGWGGLEINVYRLAGWMRSRGWNIIIYANPDSSLFKAAKKDNFKVVGINSSSKFGDLLQVFKLIRSLKKENVKAVVLHTNKNFILTSLTRYLSTHKFKFIYHQHMHVGHAKKDFFHNWLYRQLDIWMTTLPILGYLVSQHTNLDPKKIRVVPNGLELNRFIDNKPAKSEARQKLALPPEEIVIGMIGRIDPKKCQHLLIDALPLIHKAGFLVHLLLLGKRSDEFPKYYDQQIAFVKKNHLEEYVHFRDHIDKPEFGFAALDIFAQTAASETFGMVTIEAMVSGIPVVGSARGGTLDIITHEKTGLLFQARYAPGLAEILISLLKNPDWTKKMAQAAHDEAIQKYAHTTQCEKLENIIDELTA